MPFNFLLPSVQKTTPKTEVGMGSGQSGYLLAQALQPAHPLLLYSQSLILSLSRLRPLSLQNTAATGKLISMPELPDIVAYIGALESRVLGQPLQRMRLASPFLLRTSQPPLASVEGRYRPRTAARWQAYSI